MKYKRLTKNNEKKKEKKESFMGKKWEVKNIIVTNQAIYLLYC